MSSATGALATLLLTAAVASAAPAAPALESPASGATVEAAPSFTWKPVRRAALYEFQLSADSNFGSIVLGQGTGSFRTRNTAGTIQRSIPDGTYFWRVRALDAKGNAGRWSAERTIVKSWSTRAELVSPVGDAQVTFPGVPLVLRWTPVPRAFKYNVYVGTDPGLGTLVVSDRGKPIQTSGTVFSPATALPPGKYYWAIEPVDAANHRGRRSVVGAFVWSWPTASVTRTTDLIEDLRVMDPRFSWDPVPGAVAYEVEVNFSEDFAPGSKVCCTELSTGTSLTPKALQPNNYYYWRVRALDSSGNPGQWNYGPSFDKNFGNYRGNPALPPTVESVRLRDNDSPAGATDLEPATPVVDTDTPVMTWAPVVGASHYEVQVGPHRGGACVWNARTGEGWRSVETAATAWTPIVRGGMTPDPGWPNTTGDVGNFNGSPTNEFCFRVRARTGDADIWSDWTQYPRTGDTPAFRYSPWPAQAPPSTQLKLPADHYLEPTASSSHQRLPLFTWKRIPGANSYWVVVARDRLFTNIVDLNLTQIPAYAPRLRGEPWTYEDDDTPLYWAVLPAKGASGEDATSQPVENFERPFVKQSERPVRLTPDNGADINTQPEFRWTAVEGVKRYRLEVSQDPTFPRPLVDEVTTTATSYTSVKYYPADTVLYWRVRADDIRDVGLRWSETGTFRRRLTVPAISSDNPLGGSTIPALTWQAVQGANSYTMLVDQSDGTRKEFTLRGTAFTPVIFYGTGVWRWQVRANYGAGASTAVSSGYTGLVPYARRIPAPVGAHVGYRKNRMLVAWDASTMVKQYRVQISTTNSFSSTFVDVTTDNLSYAPDMTSRAITDGGRFYWRVAAVDEGRNVGAWAAGTFKAPRRMVASLSGGMTKGRRGPVIVRVADFKGKLLRGAKVSVSGAARSRPRRTGRKGTARFALRPTRRGTVKFRVTLAGHVPVTAEATVR